MKVGILILAIYLIGVVVSYLLFRRYSKKHLPQYTIAERIINIKSSVFSWIGVLAAMIMMYQDWYKENKTKPVKW